MFLTVKSSTSFTFSVCDIFTVNVFSKSSCLSSTGKLPISSSILRTLFTFYTQTVSLTSTFIEGWTLFYETPKFTLDGTTFTFFGFENIPKNTSPSMLFIEAILTCYSTTFALINRRKSTGNSSLSLTIFRIPIPSLPWTSFLDTSTTFESDTSIRTTISTFSASI